MHQQRSQRAKAAMAVTPAVEDSHQTLMLLVLLVRPSTELLRPRKALAAQAPQCRQVLEPPLSSLRTAAPASRMVALGAPSQACARLRPSPPSRRAGWEQPLRMAEMMRMLPHSRRSLVTRRQKGSPLAAAGRGRLRTLYELTEGVKMRLQQPQRRPAAVPRSHLFSAPRVRLSSASPRFPPSAPAASPLFRKRSARQKRLALQMVALGQRLRGERRSLRRKTSGPRPQSRTATTSSSIAAACGAAAA